MELKLFYVGDVLEMSEEQVNVAMDFITGLVYGVVATNNPETGARLSALNNLQGQKMDKLHFGTDSNSQKAKNLQADPRMEVMYTDGNGGQIMLSGKVEFVTDLETKKALWEDWMNEYSPEGPKGDGMCFICFKPETVRAMIS